MSQRSLNKAVKWSWSELEGRDNDTLRVVLLTERDILLYSAIASAVYWQTRWQDTPGSFGDVEHYATEALKRLLMPIDICELVADCIRNNGDVQEAIQGEAGSGYGPKTVINNTQYTNNVFVSGDADSNGCTNDAKFGRIKALVAYIDTVMLDFFQVIDAATNIISQLDELISAAPVFETLPIDEAIGVIGSTGEFWRDSYDASVNTQLLEGIECELWCRYGADCDITVGNVRELILERYNFNSTRGALNVFSAFAVFARIAGTIAAGGVGAYIGDDFVYLSWLLQLSAVEASGQFFGVDPIDYVSQASNGTPNNSWSLCGCTNCIDANFTSGGKSGWVARVRNGAADATWVGDGWIRGDLVTNGQDEITIIRQLAQVGTIASVEVTYVNYSDPGRSGKLRVEDGVNSLQVNIGQNTSDTVVFSNLNWPSVSEVTVRLFSEPQSGPMDSGKITSVLICYA